MYNHKTKKNRSKKRLRFSGGTKQITGGTKQITGGTKQITASEVDRCDKFCNTEYLKRNKKFFSKIYRGMNKRMNKKTTTNDLDAAYEGRKPTLIEDCKRNFCNPHCPHLGKNKATREFCPICNKSFKELGAITYCQFDPSIV